MTEDVEAPLFLRKYKVPFHALSYVFGENALKWFRREPSIGRNSLVGTTIRSTDDLPQHLLADEKHTWIKGEKAYIATTVANHCILGVSVAKKADEPELTNAYGVFKAQTRKLQPDYAPQPVTTDGWAATQNAWKTLFSSPLLILCFWPVFLQIRDWAKKPFKDSFAQIAEQLWNGFRAPHKRTFSQRIRRRLEWSSIHPIPSIISAKLETRREKSTFFTRASDFPAAPRTTRMVDRLMPRMDKHLFSVQYFHGSHQTAELSIRSWALIQNWAPSNPYTINQFNGWPSPAERLSQFRYHDNWWQNLLVSASQRQYSGYPPNPL